MEYILMAEDDFDNSLVILYQGTDLDALRQAYEDSFKTPPFFRCRHICCIQNGKVIPLSYEEWESVCGIVDAW